MQTLLFQGIEAPVEYCAGSTSLTAPYKTRCAQPTFQCLLLSYRQFRCTLDLPKHLCDGCQHVQACCLLCGHEQVTNGLQQCHQQGLSASTCSLYRTLQQGQTPRARRPRGTHSQHKMDGHNPNSTPVNSLLIQQLVCLRADDQPCNVHCSGINLPRPPDARISMMQGYQQQVLHSRHQTAALY